MQVLFFVFYLLPLLAIILWIRFEISNKNVYSRIMLGTICIVMAGYYTYGHSSKMNHGRNVVQIDIINKITKACESGCNQEAILEIKRSYGY